jgi:hypothetical protein
MYCDHVALIDAVGSLAAILKAGESLGRLYPPAVETPSKRLFLRKTLQRLLARQKEMGIAFKVAQYLTCLRQVVV